MLKPNVSIVLSDRNWILERLGLELQKRLPNIHLNDAADPSADINYYITFACRRQKMPTAEMGWFAHMEQAPHLQDLFFESARTMDLAVCHSAFYGDMLRDKGIENVAVIPPGVDHDRFEVKMRVAVVGRTYHTGRKGEGLVSQVMDIPGIDWHFTGPGWPGPNKFIPENELADFYRSMDYVLVPALYEGGPMCVPEALSVGTPVIASDVGWVREFPHIPFRNGDAADLRRVLLELLKEKHQKRETTLRFTWDAYAEGHEHAFRQVLKQRGASGKLHEGGVGQLPQQAEVLKKPVKLLLHGGEHKSLGGPSVRVPKTAEALQNLGVPASWAAYSRPDAISEDIVHIFNVWSPQSALTAIKQMKDAGKTVVFSPIYLDLSERGFWNDQLPNLAAEDVADAYHDARNFQAGRGRLQEAIPGYNAMVREMISLSDHVILLSNVERRALEKLGAKLDDSKVSLVRNPVDCSQWTAGDPALFRETFLSSDEDYVVCVGRIEERKNQLSLARAMKGLPLRLVLIGHAGNPAYLEKIKAEAGDQLILPGRLEAGGEMLRSAVAGARVFTLPSWVEGASLAVLEAASSGANLVLSDRSSEKEYFGDLAHYCDPGSVESLRAALEAALAVADDANRGEALRRLVQDTYNWETYAQTTQAAYLAALKTENPGKSDKKTRHTRFLPTKPRPTEVLPHNVDKIVIDITTLAHHQGRVTGISRVEDLLSAHLKSFPGVEVRFICWNDEIKKFIDVPARFATFRKAFIYRERFREQGNQPDIQISPNSIIIVAGSAWMQNAKYVRGLEYLRSRTGAALMSVIHDLVPFKFPFWFQDGYAPVFKENFLRLIQNSDQIVTVSDSCRQDVIDVAASHGISLPDITVNHSGDPHLENTGKDAAAGGHVVPSAVRETFVDRKFVLAVGAVHTRKNYEMLYRVWARFADERRLGDVHLVIVGGVAWNGQTLADQIAKDTRVSSRIHILSGVEDDDLAWLYEQCLFTCFPSHYEGWGLPVAESLLHGKICLATSASSVPEIAPEFVDHIDPEDFTTWHTKVAFYATSTSSREKREELIQTGYVRRTWKDTAARLAKIALSPQPKRQMRAVRAGEWIPTSVKLAPNLVSFSDNWFPLEGWGRWASASEASFSIRLQPDLYVNQARVLVVLSLHVCLPQRERSRLNIYSGEELLFSGDVDERDCPESIVLSVPVSQISSAGDLTVRFVLKTTTEKSRNKQPARTLGVGLSGLSVLHETLSNPLQSVKNSHLWSEVTEPFYANLSIQEHAKALSGSVVSTSAWGGGAKTGTLTLYIPVIPASQPMDLVVTYRPVATESENVKASVLWNGTNILEETWADNAERTFTYRLSAEQMSMCGPAVLEIVSDGIMTPAQLQIGTTDTISGFGISSISLVAAKED